ncbi:hypothetical protein CDL15_Pgr007642 [Punica granatum]|uniref:Uncharacterized protein n=1 Tax=Punica granatum TaxID=22663 RepID=A0A218X9M5_PUNGR|nr:hypothetical protein CDL15_Pgr007642 [Punica granatum]
MTPAFRHRINPNPAIKGNPRLGRGDCNGDGHVNNVIERRTFGNPVAGPGESRSDEDAFSGRDDNVD